jgi:hypothetical protein
MFLSPISVLMIERGLSLVQRLEEFTRGFRADSHRRLISLTVQDGIVVQVERTERRREERSQHSHKRQV